MGFLNLVTVSPHKILITYKSNKISLQWGNGIK